MIRNHQDKMWFLATALRRPAHIGAIMPSSRALARAMMRDIQIVHDRAVLELGPGTGPITRVIDQTLTNKSTYLGIEREPRFVKMLEQRYPQLRFVQGLAQEADQHLDQAGIERLGAIISGLPFATLPPSVQDDVMDCIDRLMTPGVIFRTFQYVHAWMLPMAIRFRRQMRQRFGAHRVIGPVLWNLPPALVLSWQR